MDLSQKDNHSAKRDESTKKNGRLESWFTEYLPLVPIPLGLALVVALGVLDIQSVFDPPGLLLVLNMCFLSLLPFLVAYIAVKGYLSSGSISLLMLAAGCLSLGLGSILAGFMPLTKEGLNGVVFIHNSSALLSAVFQVLGAALALVGVPPQHDRPRKNLNVLSVCLCILLFEMLLMMTTLYDEAPLFFTQGSGPTPLRQTVLGGAIAMFLVGGFLFGVLYLRTGSRFIFWYCMGLFLIAEGLFCISIQKAVGSPIGWLGRGFQYLAGIYLLVAIVNARRELGVRGLTLKAGIATLFRHHLELLVEQRTEELGRANEELRHEIAERVRVQESLRRAKDELEERVQERTWELVTTVEALQKEVTTRKEAEQGLRRTARALKALSDCNQALMHAREESFLLNEICRIIVEIGGYPVAWIGFAEEDESKTVRPMARWGVEEGDVEKLTVSWTDDERGGGPTGTAIRTGEISIWRNSANDPIAASWRAELTRYGIGSIISLPVVVEDQLIGAITIAAKDPDAFDEEELKLLEELAGDLSYGIEMLRIQTARQKAEELLSRANREWERTFNSIPDLIMILDTQHRIVRANKTMFDALARTEQEIIGKTCYELVHGTDSPPSFCPHSKLLSDGKEHAEEVLEPRLGGTYDIRVSPVVDSTGNLVGSIHISRDITGRKQTEENLRKNESLLKTVLQTAPAGIGLVRDRVIGWTNEYLSMMTGYSAEELLGQSARLLYETDDEFARVGDEKYALIRAVGTGSIETRWKRKDGSVMDIFLSSSAIDPQDLYAGVVFTATDISAQRKAIRDLHRSHRETQSLLNGTKALLEYRQFQDSARRLFDTCKTSIGATAGYVALLSEDGSENELLFLESGGLPCSVDPSLPMPIRGLRAEAYRTGKVVYENDFLNSEWMEFMPEGHVDLENVLFAPLVLEGKAVGLLGMANKPGGFDEADTRLAKAFADLASIGLLNSRAMDSLEESETRTRLLIESSPIGIRVVQDGKYRYANPAFLQMFGYETEDEVVGLSVEELYAPESRDLIQKRQADRAAGVKSPMHYEAVAVTKNGKPFQVEIWSSEIIFQGKRSALAFVNDISESKKLRAQLLQAQKMEAIGTLAGGIAHDFNNILQVVCGFSEIILMGKEKGDPEYEDLAKVLSAGKKGADLVQRLLTFSRKTDINPRPLNLNQQIQRVESILQRTIPKNIKIDLNLADGLSAINADPNQVEQILMNLAINARDAMPEGGRLIFETSNVTLDEGYCSMHLGSKPGDYVLLTVSDTGEGMDKNTLEHIFEPFFSTKPAGKGTGLGLAMVYGIVKQHDGYVTCYSEPGVGTTFKLYLPVTEMKDESIVLHEEKRLPSGSETILLVDDEDLVRELAKRILSRAGYTVLTAADGKEALQTYKKKGQTVSLIVLDLIMPEMDGKQCLRELLKINPRARVVVASGYSANGPTKEALQGGAKGFVAKPFDMGQLLQTVRKVLDSE